jgi:wobble nucleotide-excising tRNase
MKEVYRVAMVDNMDKYFGGELFGYTMKYVDVEAENAEEAEKIANETEKKFYAINAITKEAAEKAEAEAENAYWDRIAEERATAKKKAETEKRKAKEKGMTAEEYKKYKAEKAKKTRYNREIKEMEEEIERMKKAIAYRKKAIEEMEARGI